MKFFIASSLLLALEAYAQTGVVGTPAAINPTANVNPADSAMPANPSVNPAPVVRADGTIDNPTMGTYDPVKPIQDSRQSQEYNPRTPGLPSAYPPVNNPGQPANVDRSGRPVIP